MGTGDQLEVRAAGRVEPGAKVDRLARIVVDAALEVHGALGPGYLEAVYQEALCLELRLREVPFASEAAVAVSYKGQMVGEGRIDILVDSTLIVELKAVDALAPIHVAQVISYLKATGLHLGLLINFNVPTLRDGIKRIVYS
jgi:GxxExxY protein